MSRQLRTSLCALAVAAPLAAFSVPTAGASTGSSPDTRQEAYAAAAREFGVPESVLLGVSYLESRWEHHAGKPSKTGGYGPMHLTDVQVPDAAGDPAHAATMVTPLDPALHTLDLAAELTGTDAVTLRTDPAANIRGGAAVLADYQRDLSLPTGDDSDPGRWYAAVARYGGASTRQAAESFANQVFSRVRDGVARITAAGERIALAPSPAVEPRRQQAAEFELRDSAEGGRVECPKKLGCRWIPAPYEQYGEGPGDYGNHDLADRPNDLNIDYIVVHDTEETWDRTLELVQDPEYVSWQYTIRSNDGQVAQHVRNKDVAWQAGNWYVNMHSIGIEHEGYEADGSWYTEAMYQNSAALVRYLAEKYDIPLDRSHIIGHDQVPAITPGRVPAMHHDPGPYWDWEHYFDLLKSPIAPDSHPRGAVVTIKPGFDGNEQVVTGCGDDPDEPCEEQGTNFVYLHTEPNADSPLVNDVGLRPDGSPNTTHVSDIGARAAAGAQHAYAGRDGDWTAIWYLGQKAWFHDPADQPAAVRGFGLVVQPKAGKDSIPFYGRAYPEKSAYPEDIPYQEIVPLQYSLNAGQTAVIGDGKIQTDYYFAREYNVPGRQVLGKDRYYLVWMGHRMGYVRAADVDVRAGIA